MKGLHKKLSVIALSGMLFSGGFLGSKLVVHADSNKVMDERMFKAIISYIEDDSAKSKFEISNYNYFNDSEVKWYKFSFYDILDFLDYARLNKIESGKYKIGLERENLILLVEFS